MNQNQIVDVLYRINEGAQICHSVENTLDKLLEANLIYFDEDNRESIMEYSLSFFDEYNCINNYYAFEDFDYFRDDLYGFIRDIGMVLLKVDEAYEILVDNIKRLLCIASQLFIISREEFYQLKEYSIEFRYEYLERV